MDSTPSPSLRRRPWWAMAALAVAATALAPVLVARAGPEAAGASPVGSSTPTTASTGAAAATVAAILDATSAPAAGPTTTTSAPAAGPTTTTSAPAADPTTTTSAPAAGPTTTTTAAAAGTTSTTAPPATSSTTSTTGAVRTADSADSGQLAQVEAIADSSGFDWRAAGVVIHIGYNPTDCCHWGIYDYRDNSLWIGPTAFASPTRLRYVVLHELGHAWQWASGHRDQLAADMAPWGVSGEEALEYSADCIATVEGAQMDNYWACPAAAQAIVSRRLSGDWT